jgi:amidohydrolase
VSEQWISELTGAARRQVGALERELLDLSHAVHAEPELRFAEHAAAGRLTGLLGVHGFDVETGLAGLPTAFRATRAVGGGGPTLAVFCEYDALPGLGHGCGHNVIAAAGAGAALATAELLARRGTAGRVVVLGSPGEEGGGGKALLAEAGALDGIDAAVMAHPAGFDAVSRTNLGRLSLRAAFTGRASHAAAAPEQGRNALDAATLLLVAIGLLRQQVRADSRIHAKVAEGGQSINIIPERSVVELFLRSPDHAYLRGRLTDALRDCVLGAALATGCTAELDEVAPAYDPVRANPVLAGLAAQAFTALGRPLDPATGWSGPAGSTDMGNVSQLLPALHPYVCVKPGVALHTREFTAVAAGEGGDRAVVDAAALLATLLTALFTRPALLAQARERFAEGSG